MIPHSTSTFLDPVCYYPDYCAVYKLESFVLVYWWKKVPIPGVVVSRLYLLKTSVPWLFHLCRIGQTKDVKIYRLITRNTYEQRLFECSSRKYGLDEAILGNRMGVDISQDHNKKIESLLKHEAYDLLKVCRIWWHSGEKGWISCSCDDFTLSSSHVLGTSQLQALRSSVHIEACITWFF